MSRIYIQRRLLHGDRPVNQADLPGLGRVLLVLGNPGDGKTDLLADLGRRLNVTPRTASRFRHQTNLISDNSLLIDALDEVVRLDPDAIDPIIVKASEVNAPLVIFSSRSSEWDPARTRLIQECFGVEPVIVRLLPLDEGEQKTLFAAWFPDEDFDSFAAEVDRFELRPLFGNPQFLRLFAEAYVQSGRRFTSKRQIFVDAVLRLASERDDSPKQKGRAPIQSIVEAAEEVFAKILLSGTSGISQSEDPAEVEFSYLSQLSSRNQQLLKNMVDTRLFKPAGETALHVPVHRIVAEYCAAQYLVRRVDDAGDLLSIRRVLAVVAPNGAVRDELRGLLGWMASLGSLDVQTVCIEIDPYAVLANGDPSQLRGQSKKFLLRKLRQLSDIDPFFRRSDSWRRFSVAGFFDSSTIDLVRGELVGSEAAPILCDLLLELLQGSEAVSNLVLELQSLLLDVACTTSTRIRAQSLLLEISGHDHRRDFLALIDLGDRTSLRLAAEAAVHYPAGTIGWDEIKTLLQASGQQHDEGWRRSDQHIEHRFYVGNFIAQLDLDCVIWLLDELTRGLSCSCGAESDYTCTCLHAISGIAGRLLDRYFALATEPHNPERIWVWVKPLRFKRQATEKNSPSVKALRKGAELRRAIYRIVLGGQKTPDDAWKALMALTPFHAHSGLYPDSDDYLAIVDHAFETGDLVLWEGMYFRHNRYRSDRGPDNLRTRMRAQAREAPELLRIWSRNERKAREADTRELASWGRRRRRFERREAGKEDSTREFFRNNREQIVAGRHWGALSWIADRYLLEPEKLGDMFEETTDAEHALRNCFEFLRPHIPPLSSLADNTPPVIRVLHAACLAQFRFAGNLDGVERDVLTAVRKDIGGYSGCEDGEADDLRAAVDLRIFATLGEIEAYARTFIEPQFSRASDAHTDAGMLRYDKAFGPIGDRLAFEWLERNPDMPFQARDTLFDVCAIGANRSALNALIEKRCADFIENGAESELEAKIRDFWFVRGFFFLENPRQEIWDRFRTDKDTIFWIERRAGWINRSENENWPKLSAEKIYGVMDMFVEPWPKVPLPGSFGTGDPPEETAYRFLVDIVQRIDDDTPENSIPVLNRLCDDARFSDFHDIAKSQRVSAMRKQALKDFMAPSANEIVAMLDHQQLATVEDLRAFMVEELDKLEKWVRGSETDPLETFYEKGKHVDENTARNRIVDRLQNRMAALNLNVTIERYMADQKRCDITVSTLLAGIQQLLVVEVKGQWHGELFTAANTQLHERYSSHPDAAQQGIYLILWFGPEVQIGGKKTTKITNPSALRESIVEQMPNELRSVIDVVVIDLSPRKKS